MRKGFYTKLAASNIKKNSRTYIPYIITCIITAAMFYIINSLSNNESIKKLYGGETILITLGYGTYASEHESELTANLVASPIPIPFTA